MDNPAPSQHDVHKHSQDWALKRLDRSRFIEVSHGATPAQSLHSWISFVLGRHHRSQTHTNWVAKQASKHLPLCATTQQGPRRKLQLLPDHQKLHPLTQQDQVTRSRLLIGPQGVLSFLFLSHPFSKQLVARPVAASTLSPCFYVELLLLAPVTTPCLRSCYHPLTPDADSIFDPRHDFWLWPLAWLLTLALIFWHDSQRWPWLRPLGQTASWPWQL